MTNAMDELRARVEGATPQAAAASAAQDRKKYRLDSTPPWLRYRAIEGTVASITEGRHLEFSDLAVITLKDVTDRLILKNYNPREDDLTDAFEVRLPAIDKRIQREWEPMILMAESAQAFGVETVWGLIGRKVRFEIDIEFIYDSAGNPVKDAKNYDRETLFYRVASVADGKSPNGTAAAPPDPEKVQALAAWCVGQEKSAVRAPLLLKAIQKLGIADAGLQSLIVSGKFVKYATDSNLLAEAEGMYYDPTANSA